MALSQSEFEANFDLVECREFNQEFNLGGQMYYDNLCPSCRTEQSNDA